MIYVLYDWHEFCLHAKKTTNHSYASLFPYVCPRVCAPLIQTTEFLGLFCVVSGSTATNRTHNAVDTILSKRDFGYDYDYGYHTFRVIFAFTMLSV